jgi:alpha-L-rhamnosidase
LGFETPGGLNSYDYLMHGKDKDFLKTKLLGSRQILNYFISYVDEDGSLKNVPGWNFTDWVPGWGRGTAPVAEDGSSALMDLQLLLALQSATNLEKTVGSQDYAVLYDKLAKELAKTILDKYWDDSKNLFADTPEKDKFSQHANSLGILADLVDDQKANVIAKLMLSDTTLAPASIYFKYYLHLALVKAGLGDNYINWLDVWRKNIDLGLTTWGETSEVETTRSDCHAWGSSPNIEFSRVVLGIESDAPYFEKVKIELHLGTIKQISGEIPHPAGKISVDYNNSENSFKAEINLPEGISGTFVWKGKQYDLSGGLNKLGSGD